MANTQIAGFRPRYRTDGASITYRRRKVLSNNTNAIALYDAVVNDANGDTILATTTTTAVASVAMGASYEDADNNRVGAKSLPASTTYTGTNNISPDMNWIFIVENPVDVIFLCSVDAAIAETDLDLNYAMVLTASSNGISNHELNDSGRANTATLPWRVLDYVDSPESDADLADAQVDAMINAGLIYPAMSNYTGT